MIYAVIVGAWAVVLVPRWLHRHDEAAAERTRSVPPATHVLPRRHRKPAGSTRFDVPASGPPPSREEPSRRRRRTLAALLMLLTVPAVAVGLGLVPWWAVVAPVLLVTAYLLCVRRQVRRRRRRSAEMARRRQVARAAAQARRRQQAELQRRQRRVVPAPPVVPIRPLEAVEDGPCDNTWSPVPVPLPTYVTAATAPKRFTLGASSARGSDGAPQGGAAVRSTDQRAVND